jgi:putative ABC transport system permease protein
MAVLTLGIGASTAIFSVVDAVALRGLPFDRSDQLVAVSETMAVPTMPHGLVYSPGLFSAWRDANDVFSELEAISQPRRKQRPWPLGAPNDMTYLTDHALR